jgi:hypothetical protein
MVFPSDLEKDVREHAALEGCLRKCWASALERFHQIVD